MKKAISLTLAAALCLSLLPLVMAAAPITSNKRGTIDGFEYEYWSQYPADKGSMTLTGGGTFECSWNGYNMLFRTGRKFDSTKSYKDYGTMTVDYAAEYTITKGDVSYLTVYGWTESPLVEFYVLESYASYKPGNTYKGTIEVDGGTYEVWEATRVNQPSIQGTKTFQQYFSIRVDKRTEGTITLTDHFKAWEELGLKMNGKLFEISLCAEGFNSAGSAKISKHVMTIGDEVFGADKDAPKPTDTPAPTEPPEPVPTDEPELVIAPNLNSAHDWARESIQLACNHDLVPDGLLNHYTDTITRAEYCALTVQFYETVTGKTIAETKTFSDTADVNVQKLGGLGIVSGSGDGTFNPDGEFSRAEVAVMTVQLLNKLGKPLPVAAPAFADNVDIPAWARGAVGQAQAAGLMSGVGDNKFGPGVKYSREQGIMLSMVLWEKYQ